MSVTFKEIKSDKKTGKKGINHGDIDWAEGKKKMGVKLSPEKNDNFD